MRKNPYIWGSFYHTSIFRYVIIIDKRGELMKRLIYRNDSDQILALIKKDYMLEALFMNKEEVIVVIQDNYFLSLVEIIIAQQLSTKVASIILNRLKALFTHGLNPADLLELSDDALRAVGLSYQKIKYLKSLSLFFLTNLNIKEEFETMDNQTIINKLIEINGIGIWSAEMFLIFSLAREDVFSVSDLGLRNAVKKLYQNQELSNDEITKISLKWAPYRSIVSHFLWHAWDNIK
jgi:DNA-3-methyladenine glycosylase II